MLRFVLTLDGVAFAERMPELDHLSVGVLLKGVSRVVVVAYEGRWWAEKLHWHSRERAWSTHCQ